MKNLLGLLIISTFLFSCGPQQNCSNGVQDGSETGVDCGGNCPPCAGNGGGGSGGGGGGTSGNVLQDLQGMWYTNITVNRQTNSVFGGGIKNTANLYLGTNCMVDFTMNNPFPGPSVTYYDMYGHYTPGTCNYPTAGVYNYNPNNNTLSNLVVENINSDTLHLNNLAPNQDYYLHRSPLTQANSTTVQWEVELPTAYPYNNALEINIYKNGAPVPIDIIPIVSGQLMYTGTETISLASATKNIYIYVRSVATGAIPGSSVQFSTRIKLNGQVISETGMHTFCVVGTATGCSSGIDPLAGGTFATLTWSQ